MRETKNTKQMIIEMFNSLTKEEQYEIVHEIGKIRNRQMEEYEENMEENKMTNFFKDYRTQISKQELKQEDYTQDDYKSIEGVHKYEVIGTFTVTICKIIEANNSNDALDMAQDEFRGVQQSLDQDELFVIGNDERIYCDDNPNIDWHDVYIVD